MLKSKSLWPCSILLLVELGSSAYADTVTTKTGCIVSHSHYSYCTPTYCPIADSTFEARYGFRSADRVYSGTAAWNCHGRTFDARNAWINFAEPWLSCDAPYTPASPAPGHAVIFWGPDGKTSHSVTLVGPWSGLSTLAMSKYGVQGQYRHALSNSIRVYGSDASVVAFGAGTSVYSGLAASQPDQASPIGVRQRLLEERERAPWFETMLTAELLYAAEHPRLVAQVSGLLDATRRRLEEATTINEQVDALATDFRDPMHYSFLSAYSSPAHSEDFISAIEAGNLLIKLAERRPKLRGAVIAKLQESIEQARGEEQDRVRGAALHFLGRVLTAAERQTLLVRTKPQIRSDAADAPPTYSQHYLRKFEALRQ